MKKGITQFIILMFVISSFQVIVSAEEDIEPPQLLSYEFSEGNYTIGDNVDVRVVAKDNLDSAPRVYVVLRKPITGKSQSVWMTHQGEGVYKGQLKIEEGMESGKYVLDFISLEDNQLNTRNIHRSIDDTQSFEVYGTNSDTEAPELISYKFEEGKFTVGDTVNVQVVARDNRDLSPHVYVILRKPVTGNSQSVRMIHQGEGVYKGQLKIEEGMESGKYVLDFISLEDSQLNTRNIHRSINDTQSFEVYETNSDTEAPELISYKIEEGEFTIGDTVNVQVVARDNRDPSPHVYVILRKPLTGSSQSVRMIHQGSGLYEGELTIVDRMESGRYMLDFILLEDNYLNSRYFHRQSEDTQGFTIRYPSTDRVAPIFNRLEASDIELDEYETAFFAVYATDDLKLKSADAVFVNGGERVILSSSNVTPSGFHFEVNHGDFPEGTGTWVLNTLTLADLNQNITSILDGLDFKVTILSEREINIDHTPVTVTGVTGGLTKDTVTPRFTEGTATLNGQPFTSGTTISSDGDYELKVTDKGGNETTVRFRIDRKPVIVTGVESGKTYQQVKPIFTEGVGKLNGASYVSGTNINQTGDYVLIVTDDAGNETKLSFSIDRTSPVISGLVDGKQSYREVTPLFNEGTASLNGKTFVSGTKLVQEGKYVLKVTDQVGNVTTREFTIDRTTPIVSGITSKQLTNKSVTVTFNEGSATINGKNIASGQTVVASGVYSLRVTDEAGNVKLLTFTIDKVAPSKPTISTLTNKSTKVTGKAEKGSTVSITYNGRTYTTKASTAGTYSYSLKTTKAGATVTVRAKDAAGNLSTAASSKVLNTFATFTVNTVKSSATSVTGKGNKAATVQAFVGTKAISKTAKVDSKGNYKLTIPRQKAGMTVTVKITQTGYQELKKMTKVVK